MAKTIVYTTDTINTWKEKTNDISADLGDIVLLTTDLDSDVVGAINSIDSNLGARETLTTIDKTSVVAAINEHDAELGDSALTTFAQTIRGAINEHDAEIGDSALTTTGQTLRSAINEHDSEIGDMVLTGLTATDLSAATRELRTELGDVTTLTTIEKSNTVGAIVEVVERVDSLDALLDQAVLTTSDVRFNTVTTGNNQSTTAGAVHSSTYTVDATAGIVLDAGTTTVIKKNGVTKFTLRDSATNQQIVQVPGTFHVHAGDDIKLDAGGGDWVLEDQEITQFQFSGAGTGNKRISIPIGDLLVDTQAADGEITLQAGATSGKVIHSAGGTEMMNFTNGSINRTGSLTIDASANINLDADGGSILFKDDGTTQMTFIGGTNKEIDVASGNLTIDVPGNVSVNADGGSVSFDDADSNHFTFTGTGATKTVAVAKGDLTFDVAGDVNIDADGGDVVFKDNGTTTLTFTGGTVSRTGDFTVDASGDIVLDADGADVLLKDGGTQFGSLTNSSSNLVVKSGTATALTFKGSASGPTKRAVVVNGPVFTGDSALSDSMGGKSLVGAMNFLWTNLQDADAYAGTLSLSTSATNLTDAVNELDAEHGVLTNLTTTSKSTFVGAINELDGDIGNKTSLTTTAKTSLVAAINELDTDVGSRTSLTTTNKTNLVAAINELNAMSTDSVGEGSTNLYYTNTRARGAISVTSSTGLTYTSGTGVLAGVNATKSVKGVASFDSDNFIVSSGAVRLRISAANSGTGYGSLSYDSDTSKFTFAKVTDANIRGRISAANSGTGYGSLSYSSSTGAITYSKVTDANIRGAFSGTSPVSISTGGAISVGTADTTTKGIASFDANSFDVTDGKVSLKSSGFITNDQISTGADIALSKLADIDTDRVLGRTAAGTGAVSAVQVNTAMIEDDAVTYSKMQNVATANRLLGSTTAGGLVSEVQVETGMIAAGAVTAAKLSGSATLNIKNSSGTVLFTITGIG